MSDYCKSQKEAPGRVHILLTSQLLSGRRAVYGYPSLTLYELTVCFIIGIIVMHI